MAEKYPAETRTEPANDDLNGEESISNEEICATNEESETVPKQLWSDAESAIWHHRNEPSTFVKEVLRGNGGEGASGEMGPSSEFKEAASRLPSSVKNVTFVQNTVVHGNMTRENIMNKQEVGDGGLIQHTTIMEPQNAPKILSDEELEDRAGYSMDKIHQQTLSTQDIEIELSGLPKPNEVIPPNMTVTTKDAIVGDSAMDEKYYPEMKTFHRTRAHENPIPYEEIVQDNKGCVITGPAGSGKSTTLKKLVKDVIRKENKKPKKRKNRKLVLYIELKLLQYETHIKSDEALLNVASRGVVELEDRDILIEWMNKNPKNIVIALDGYDQIPKNITEDDSIPKHGYRNSTLNQYLYGLLTGKVLPGALVVLSTREYALQNIPYICVPQRVIRLVGLSHENIDKLVVQLSSVNVLDTIKNSDPVVYYLCSSPIFLNLITWVHSCVTDNPPETKSGILMCVILNFLQLQSHIKGRTLQNIYKLAELSLYGIENSKIVFTQVEISRFGLQQQDLKDMVIGVPRKLSYTGSIQKLISGNYQQYFVHQMLQEVLASLKIILMDKDQFGGYFGRLAGDNFQEVAQLTYGLLFRDENQKMLFELADAVNDEITKHVSSTQKEDEHDNGQFDKLKDLSEHRTIALKHLKARLKDGKVGDLQTLRLLYESGDAAIIQNNVKEIRWDSLNEFDCFCLGKVLEKSKELSALWLSDTNDDLIGILIQSCEKIPKIDSLMIVGYFDSPTTIGKYCGKLSNHANKLVLVGCKFTKQEFDSFVDEIEEKFTGVGLGATHVKLEHLDGLVRLMSHIDGTLHLFDVYDDSGRTFISRTFIDGTLDLMDVYDGDDNIGQALDRLNLSRTFISSEVKEKIPRQYQACTVEYWSELTRIEQPVPQIEAEQPIATEGDIPRLNQSRRLRRNGADGKRCILL